MIMDMFYPTSATKQRQTPSSIAKVSVVNQNKLCRRHFGRNLQQNTKTHNETISINIFQLKTKDAIKSRKRIFSFLFQFIYQSNKN